MWRQKNNFKLSNLFKDEIIVGHIQIADFRFISHVKQMIRKELFIKIERGYAQITVTSF